jgi:hypothetical protein
MGDDKAETEEKPVAKKPVDSAPKTTAENPATASVPVQEEKPAKKFEGRGLAGLVKKLSEEKLEDKAKRITDKLEKNPDKKDKVVEKEKKAPAKKPATKKTEEKAPAKKAAKEEKAPAKKTTKK